MLIYLLLRASLAGFLRIPGLLVHCGTAATLLGLVAVGPAKAAAQITPLDTIGINYPGWQSADQVAPRIKVDVSFDSLRGLWTYRYTVVNDTSARQAIYKISFGLDPLAAPDSLTATAPVGWRTLVFPYGNAWQPGVMFRANFADSTSSGGSPPPALIPPGDSLAGFVITSPYAPGYAQSYIQGYVELPPIGEEDLVYPPPDTTNAQRQVTIFPNQYIITPNLNAAQPAAVAARPGGLLGTIVPAPKGRGARGALLRGSVPVAVKLVPHGGQIDRKTFRAFLNGIDVTRMFQPAPRGGVDLVAVFKLGSSPLRVGRNRLITTVAGVPPRKGRRTVDTSEVHFTVKR